MLVDKLEIVNDNIKGNSTLNQSGVDIITMINILCYQALKYCKRGTPTILESGEVIEEDDKWIDLC